MDHGQIPAPRRDSDETSDIASAHVRGPATHVKYGHIFVERGPSPAIRDVLPDPLCAEEHGHDRNEHHEMPRRNTTGFYGNFRRWRLERLEMSVDKSVDSSQLLGKGLEPSRKLGRRVVCQLAHEGTAF
jgi:hypothetical protein